MAGIFDQWQNPQAGEMKTSFSIITCEANEFLVEIHNTKKRMPFMLRNGQFEGWLSSKPEDIAKYLFPSKNEMIAAHKINPRIVNRSNHNCPEGMLEYIDPKNAQASLF